jgi:hypothetical protein
VRAPGGVLDLRQYTLVPGQRDKLIDLFDRYFVDGQEDAGIHVVGQFRDLDDADRFVWLRGFDSMHARGEALHRFYRGPVWQAHRKQANATMLDTGDALLLEPVHLGRGYPARGEPVPSARSRTVVAITIAYLASPVTDTDRKLAASVRNVLCAAAADVIAVLATHAAENNFLALPLRDEHVLVWITRFPDDPAYARHRDLLADSPGWTDVVAQLAQRSSQLSMQQLRLRPTGRSQLR